MLPNVVIVGAQKAATTFLQRGLQDHPEAKVIPGETETFSDPTYGPIALRELESSFEGSDAKRVRVIKNAEYLTKPEVPARLRKHLSGARLIAVLRDPVARLLSAYYHLIKYNKLPHVHHEEGIPKVLDGKWSDHYPVSASLLDNGRYATGLRRYYDEFPKEQVLCFLHEDVASDSLGALKSVYRFLEITEDHTTANLRRRSQAVVYSLPRLRLLSLRNPFCFQRTPTGSRMRGGPLAKLAWYGGEFVDRALFAKVWGNQKPFLSDNLAARLYDVFREEVEALESLLGRDLNHWKHRAA
ncbi:MAG: sulfotransferase [Verrucomicrobiota bacterium]